MIARLREAGKDERGDEKTPSARVFLGSLKAVILNWCAPSPKVIEKFDDLLVRTRELKGELPDGTPIALRIKAPVGLSARNKHRLEAIDDRVFALMAALPDEVMDEVDVAVGDGQATWQQSKRYETAFAMALVQKKSVRGRDLAHLGNGVFVASREGEPGRWEFRSSKTGHLTTIKMTDKLMRRYQRLQAVYRPVIVAAMGDGYVDNGRVFPGSDGGSIRPQSLAIRICSLYKRRLGLIFNNHLHRHLSGAVMDEGGASIPDIASHLGISDRTARGYYTRDRSELSEKIFDEAMAAKIARGSGRG